MKKVFLLFFIFISSLAAKVVVTPDAVAQELGEMFRFLSELRYNRGEFDGIARRPVFLKTHACAQGTFQVETKLPKEYQVGIFKESARYPLQVRFSSDTVPTTSDHENNTLGFAMKLSEVPAYTNGLGGTETSQDFLTQNHDVFFVDTALDFLAFSQHIFGRASGRNLDDYLRDNPKADKVLKEMSKEVHNILLSSFWSVTPYKYGASTYAKYKITPCDPDSINSEKPDLTDTNYLGTRLNRDLSLQTHCFNFQVQLQKDPKEMPLDQATVKWCEKQSLDPMNECFKKEASIPQTVAKIILPIQENLEDLFEECESMDFNPGRAHPEHQVAGSLNQARSFVYSFLSGFRGTINGTKKDLAQPHTQNANPSNNILFDQFPDADLSFYEIYEAPK